MRKDRTTAALIALFLGSIGAHWFYLNRAGIGILHIIFFWTGIPALLGLIYAIKWLGMDDRSFDEKYLGEKLDARAFPPKKRKRKSKRETRVTYQRRQQKTPLKKDRKKAVAHIKKGKKLFKDYDLNGAIEEFSKALDLDNTNPAIHFNLACSFSLNEEKERAFYHLEEAINKGFDDFGKIKSHDALAYLRIQPEFNTFESNCLQSNTPEQVKAKNLDLLDSTPNLLEQLKKLQLLRKSGHITEKAFQKEKRKLLS